MTNEEIDSELARWRESPSSIMLYATNRLIEGLAKRLEESEKGWQKAENELAMEGAKKQQALDEANAAKLELQEIKKKYTKIPVISKHIDDSK